MHVFPDRNENLETSLHTRNYKDYAVKLPIIIQIFRKFSKK